MVGRQPDQRVQAPVNWQDWASLTFLHWPLEPAALRPLLPHDLTVDTFDGAAWVGVTPFVMRQVRVPGVPGRVVPDFVEVNVRTYVRGPDGRDGLWFLSLDCPRWPVVAALRTLGLPYHHARATVRTDGATVAYTSQRRGGWATLRAAVRAGHHLPDCDALTEFITGRWNAYTERLGRLWRVPVEHEPWPLHSAAADVDATELLTAGGLPAPDREPLVHFAPLVHARLHAPVPA